MFLFVSFITVLLCIFYILLYLFFIKGWGDLEESRSDKEEAYTQHFSIIVPARNEVDNIGNTLADLYAQNYPKHLFEIIVIDDHSSDGTLRIIKKFKITHPQLSIKIIRMAALPLKNHIAYKKEAINEGIKQSTHDWIITTDADCRRGKGWLASIAGYINSKNPIMICGPVVYDGGHSIFEHSQSLECLGLMGMGAASLQNNFPNMCNGANLAYQKKAFEKVNGYSGADTLASGDDEFLMHKMHNRWPGKVKFIKDKAAVVNTKPVNGLSEFIQQRKRWVSKSRKYSIKSITAILILSYLFNLCIVLNLFMGFINRDYWILLMAGLASKLLPEYIFLHSVANFFKKGSLMKYFVPGSLLHIPYVLFIGIYGNFGTYKWKGRTVK